MGSIPLWKQVIDMLNKKEKKKTEHEMMLSVFMAR